MNEQLILAAAIVNLVSAGLVAIHLLRNRKRIVSKVRTRLRNRLKKLRKKPGKP